MLPLTAPWKAKKLDFAIVLQLKNKNGLLECSMHVKRLIILKEKGNLDKMTR